MFPYPVPQIRSRIEYAVLLAAAWVFRWTPLPLSRALGKALGFLASSVLGIRKKIALSNIHDSFPGIDAKQAAQRYRAVWRHFGQVAAEFARLPRMTLKGFELSVGDGGISILRDILRRERGAIFVSGHLGNWEWLGAMTSAAGLPISYVVTTQTNSLVEKWMDRMRTSQNVEVISRHDSIRGVLSALKRNRVVAMLCDQDAGMAGVFVPFFGRLASTPRGPAVFHLKTGAPLIFGSCCRSGGRYRLIFEELIPPPPTGSREENERAIMAAVTRRLEDEVRRYPDQYLWLHRRWKTAPRIV